ncbi:MAG: glycosyltransferase family 39 protein [archaeon]
MHLNQKDFLSQEIKFNKFSVKVEFVLLLLILILGFYLRIGFLGVPPFWVDESISSVASLNILEKGFPVLDSGVIYDRALVFHYSQALSMIVFGVNDFAARFPSVVFGLLTVVLAFFVGREYSKKAGLVAALFVSIFFLEVFFSKQARFYQLFQLAFFASLFFLYKSGKNYKWIYPALACFLVAVDTQPAGLVLVPFFVTHILLFNLKKWFFSIVPIATFIFNQLTFFSITSSSSVSTVLEQGSLQKMSILYMINYFSFTTNMRYLLVFFIPGLIWSFFKNKVLTSLIILPSLIVLSGIFFLDVFAFRYAYFFSFPVILFSSLLLVFLAEKYGNILFIAIIALALIPSNLFYPFTYVTMLVPSQNNLNDFSAPEINFKTIPLEILNELKNPESIIITHYSPPVEWYIKKPDLVMPFTMTGQGNDAISYDKNGLFVDIYSGAPMIYDANALPKEKFYYIEQGFAFSKLKSEQITFVSKMKEKCSLIYENSDLGIFECN